MDSGATHCQDTERMKLPLSNLGMSPSLKSLQVVTFFTNFAVEAAGKESVKRNEVLWTAERGTVSISKMLERKQEESSREL